MAVRNPTPGTITSYAHVASWSQLVDPILLSLDHSNQISGIRKLAINHKGRPVHSEERIKGRGIGKDVGRPSLGMTGLGDGVRRASLGRTSIVLSFNLPRARQNYKNNQGVSVCNIRSVAIVFGSRLSKTAVFIMLINLLTI